MNGYRRIITGATCRQADDSRTDGIRAARLPFPAVSFHIDSPAIDHPEVTSDTDSLSGLFLTDYCKALSHAVRGNNYFHIHVVLCKLRARSGFNSTSSVIFQKKQGIYFLNKYPDVTARELAFSQNHYYRCEGS